MIENGTYRVFEDGKLVAEGKNLITSAGKRIIAGYLSGARPSWVEALAVGSGAVAASTSDKYLNFEIARAAVTSRSVTYGGGVSGAHRITLKAEIDNDISGDFYELGAYSLNVPDSAGITENILISFGTSEENWTFWDGTNWVATPEVAEVTDSRVGPDGIVLASTGGLKKYRLQDLRIDLSAYSSADSIVFATELLNGTTSSLVIRFNTDDSNYFSYTVASPSTFAISTYQAVAVSKGSWTATGNPSWSNITSIEFQITPTGTVRMMIDGIRAQDEDFVDPDFALVSRAVLASPINKQAGSLMEIEYYCDL